MNQRYLWEPMEYTTSTVSPQRGVSAMSYSILCTIQLNPIEGDRA